MPTTRSKISEYPRNPGVVMTNEEIEKSIEKYNLELMALDDQIYTLKARQIKIKLLQNALVSIQELTNASPS
jgi:hypothetical protein